MLNIKSRKNKNVARPKKKGAAKRRRVLEHRARVAALGVPEDKVAQLTVKELRAYLKNPKKTAAQFAK